MGQTQKSILGSPRYHFLFNRCPLAVESGNQQEMTAEMSNFPSMRHHRQVICRQSSATCCQNSLRYSQVATVVWSGGPSRMHKVFFSLLMKWNGRPRTIGCSVFCIAKIGVNQPKINDSGVGGVECMFRSGYLGTRVDGSKK